MPVELGMIAGVVVFVSIIIILVCRNMTRLELRGSKESNGMEETK